MERKTAKDFDQELLILFDAYVHGAIDRRGFLERAGKFAVGGMTASMLLTALSPNFAQAQQVSPNDARIKTQMVEYASTEGTGTVKAFVAWPASMSGKLPAVLVVHENRGLNPHIEDIARRLALEGYLAFAPDALTPLGGYPGDEDKAREAFARLDQTKTTEDFVAAARFLRSYEHSNGKVGVVGFCWGGGMANTLSIRVPELDAAVPFYGNLPKPDMAASVKAPLLYHFAAVDERINAAWPAYAAALDQARIPYTAFQYPGTQHGFNNDTTPRFDAEAAKLAWTRSLDFFAKHLKA